MKNNKILLQVSLLALTAYIAIFAYIYNDKQARIDEMFLQQLNNLKVHYRLTQNNFINTADATVGMLENDPQIIEILSSFLTASDEESKALRHNLEEKLKIYYQALQKQGVLQFHFLNPQNVTTFRMHKPSKYGDDLTDFKYSFKQTNLTKQAMSGLEKGRTSPSYRNVRPLYGENGLYLGIVDIAFAPEIIQKNLSEISKVHSHFILKKSIFKDRLWNRNDIKDDYITSLENDEYLEFKYHTMNKGFTEALNFLVDKKKEISQKMSESKEFSLLLSNTNESTAITFLPLHNMQNEQIAYLISYTKSPAIHKMLIDFYIMNGIIFFTIFLLALIFYKTKIYSQKLKFEKNRFYTLAQYDPLTNLPNRSLFLDRIKQAKGRALRHNQKFGLLFIDLDNFKNINDSYGHVEGDRVLKYVANQLSLLIRGEDTLARLGGDEFMIIIEELEILNDISIIADKIIALLKKPIEINNSKYYLGASIGLSVFPDDSQDVNDLIKFADTALYNVKNSGKGHSTFYSKQMSKELLERITIESEIRDAIKNEEFVVYYQPQIDASDDSLIGMEALVRWKHPTRGLVPPFEFIPIAEETGLIIELDKLVMKQAMQQFSDWYEKGLTPGVLSLNLSVKQLLQEDFISILTNLLTQTSCKNEWVELEVTEGHIMTNPEQAIHILNDISSMGIELAIDDFGTGYSSLSYLKKLPIDKLKIDQSFVRDLPDDEEDASITRAIIALAQSLNLKIIAEGVEVEAQKDFLLKNGCTYIQGYLYSKPVPAIEIEKNFLLS